MTQKQEASSWFASLRENIIEKFENIEKENGSNARFLRNKWQHECEGGGESGVMRGEIFEKVGVNFSAITGKLNQAMIERLPGAGLNGDNHFTATGISLVAHMKSPLVPAAHFNTRFIATSGKSWFGGGADLNPIYPDEKDTMDFHHALKSMCDRHNLSYYEKYKKWCDEYFWLTHRNEPRGVGGIFYDYLDSGNWELDFSFTKDVGLCFANIFVELVRRSLSKSYSKEQREYQLKKRGRYAEFNLLYDRGTRFGLETGGNVEAILMSLPPEVKW